LTGVEPDTDLEVHTVALTDIDGDPLGLLLNAQGSQAGTDCVILQCRWRAEHRHDPVAGELVHRAAIALHDCGTVVGDISHDLPRPLRTDGCGNVHRMHHIGEQHCHLLVLSGFRRCRHRRTALQTELRVLGQLDTTR